MLIILQTFVKITAITTRVVPDLPFPNTAGAGFFTIAST